MQPPFEDIAPWPPPRWTPPLSPDFQSAFDPYRPVFGIAWRAAFGHDLEQWQVETIRHALEVFPDTHPRAGEIRFRQVVISLGRQNGKTELAAALGLWALLVKASALVIGIASTAEQAGIVYRRTMEAIRGNAALRKRFDRLTDTRGIRSRAGGRYEIKANKSAALQGLPIDLGLVDELHLLKSVVWTDLVNGTGARPDCLVIGISTAGDDSSELLSSLYEQGDAAIKDAATRFGFFAWEAPEATVPEDDEVLARWLAMANPSVASGRLDLELVMSDVKGMPAPDLIRYRLNRFTQGSKASFMPLDKWLERGRREDEEFPTGSPVFTFDRTPEWGWASVTATVKDPHGNIHTEMVASIPRPNTEQLVSVAERLWTHNPSYFAADGYALKGFLAELERRGYPIWKGSQADAIGSASLLYSTVAHKRLIHGNDALLAKQIPGTIRKNIGENFRISRADSAVEIDGVLATALGVLVVENMPDSSQMVF